MDILELPRLANMRFVGSLSQPWINVTDCPINFIDHAGPHVARVSLSRQLDQPRVIAGYPLPQIFNAPCSDPVFLPLLVSGLLLRRTSAVVAQEAFGYRFGRRRAVAFEPLIEMLERQTTKDTRRKLRELDFKRRNTISVSSTVLLETAPFVI